MRREVEEYVWSRLSAVACCIAFALICCETFQGRQNVVWVCILLFSPSSVPVVAHTRVVVKIALSGQWEELQLNVFGPFLYLTKPCHLFLLPCLILGVLCDLIWLGFDSPCCADRELH